MPPKPSHAKGETIVRGGGVVVVHIFATPMLQQYKSKSFFRVWHVCTFAWAFAGVLQADSRRAVCKDEAVDRQQETIEQRAFLFIN
jgi:hypothetical protein